MTFADTGRIAIDTSDTAVYVVHVSGVFDRATGARLLRLVDARMHLRAAAHCAARTVLITLSDVREVAPGALAVLRHVGDACAHHSVELALAGTGHLSSMLSARDRDELCRHRAHPSRELIGALEAAGTEHGSGAPARTDQGEEPHP